jgi:hypothetical protein
MFFSLPTRGRKNKNVTVSKGFYYNKSFKSEVLIFVSKFSAVRGVIARSVTCSFYVRTSTRALQIRSSTLRFETKTGGESKNFT